VESPPESEDEKAALAQLLDACLGGDSGLHGELFFSFYCCGSLHHFSRSCMSLIIPHHG